MSRVLVAFFLIAAGANGQSRTAVHLEPPRVSGWIIELDRSASLERFRRDVATLDRRAGKTALNPIRHEYRRALFGAAVDLPGEAIGELRKLSYVRRVHADLEVKSCTVAATGTIDAASRVNAASLQARGEGITIGVLDSGIDYHHSAFGGGFGQGFKVSGGWDFVHGDPDPLDDFGHGTHVAGIIAANSPELSGVAPAATLIAYKVLDHAGRGRQSDIIAAIERSIDPNQDGDTSDHLDVINLSLGGIGNADDPPSRAIDNATAAGVVVVVSAGNEGQFASVRSPGTARTAITVGAVDDSGALTEFSSRGPSPANLALKPDVVAPGYQIPSAKLGGGIVSFNGTSMAAPHVAGAAALLLQLHPDWTPAQVRGALISTATRTPGATFERAAGRIDAARAASAAALIDTAGISFGLASGTTETSIVTRTVSVTNRSAAERTWQVVATNVPAGATIEATPQTLRLAPGASQSVELRLTLQNASVAFPEQIALGGDIEFLGTDPFAVPWLLLRAARLTVVYDSLAQNIQGISTDRAESPLLYSEGSAEIFVRPNTKWDVLVTSFQLEESTSSALRLLIAEDRVVTGDDRVELHRADASVELTIDGRDRRGRQLGLLESDASPGDYFLTLMFDYRKDGQAHEVSYYLGSWLRLFVTPASSSFPLYILETYVDLAAGEAYNVQHPAVSPIAESKTLTADGSAYRHARLRFNDAADSSFSYLACTTNGLRSGTYLGLTSVWCYRESPDRAKTIDYFTTIESGAAASGVMFVTGESVEANGQSFFKDRTIMQPLRGVEDGIVAADWAPSPASYRIAEGEEIVLENSARFPLAFFGTTGGFQSDYLREGLGGAFGEWDRSATHGTSWTLFDAQNAVKSVGTLSLAGPPPTPPLPEPRERFVAVRDGLRVAGTSSRAELEVKFGANGDDLVSPTLTSLRVVNGQGRLATRVDRNGSATLHFSAADLNYPQEAKSRLMKTEAARAWYRISGTTEWLPLSVFSTSTDTGSFTTLGRVPAGDLYRADLLAATAFPGSVDLRVQVEDAFGNVSTWTQSPAFVVGVPKRRSVR